MNYKFPKKILIQNSKCKLRTKNPITFVFSFLMLIALSMLVLLVLKYLDDFAFGFAVACVAVLITGYTFVFSMITRIFDKMDNYCIRVEKICSTDENTVFEIKNVGSSNILGAEISVKINEATILNNVLLNFIPVNDTIIFSHDFKLVWKTIEKIEYTVLISLDSQAKLLLHFEQEMNEINREYVIRDNSCILRRKLYYKWWI